MKLLYYLISSILIASGCRASGNEQSSGGLPEVLSGLDVLVAKRFAPLEGAKVGVITNYTGVDRRGQSIIELFASSDEFQLEAIFSPEHGLKGIIEGEYSSQRFENSGIPVYSLYGRVRKPRPEWLRGLDALVFDIQDIGTRFYTYITTMSLCMQAAAEQEIRFYVLDRPNPVSGLAVEGPVVEKELQGNFIAYYPIPVRHGMTVGELALLFNEEFGIGACLEVIRMQGWRRAMYYDDTGMKWINPSPNMRTLDAAILYPGLGITEAANFSVGRGTDFPFEIYGAPYVDGRLLARELNSAGVAGIEFRDTVFTPASHKFEGIRCGGVRAAITARDSLQTLKAGMHLLSALSRLYPDTFDMSRIDRWIGRGDVKKRLAAGEPVELIMASWNRELEEFKKVRKKYLLYEN